MLRFGCTFPNASAPRQAWITSNLTEGDDDNLQIDRFAGEQPRNGDN